MSEKKKILFVCTGNTCRSPMAETLARNILAEVAEKTAEVEVVSAGLAALPGAAAAENAVQALRELGVELEGHAARLLTAELVREADLVLTMTGSHRQQVCSLAPECADKVYTLAGYAGEGADVVDPIGGSVEVYRQCAGEIRRLVARALQKFLSPGEEDKPGN